MLEDIPSDHPDYARITMALSNDQCPDCGAVGFRDGPRGGLSQNIFCTSCGNGFNVAPTRRYVWFVQRIARARH
jgi:ribosomal protein S27AE